LPFLHLMKPKAYQPRSGFGAMTGSGSGSGIGAAAGAGAGSTTGSGAAGGAGCSFEVLHPTIPSTMTAAMEPKISLDIGFIYPFLRIVKCISTNLLKFKHKCACFAP